MGEIIEAYSFVITTLVNFMFQLDFGDGVTVGAYILAVGAMSILIRFLFRSIQAGPSVVSAYQAKLEQNALEAQREADKVERESYGYYERNRLRQENYAREFNSKFHPKKKG